MSWIESAAQLPGKALHLGIAIWWLRGMAKAESFKLTQKALDFVGISRYASYDALGRLEASGLIRVQRSPGCRPVMALLGVDQVGGRKRRLSDVNDQVAFRLENPQPNGCLHSG